MVVKDRSWVRETSKKDGNVKKVRYIHPSRLSQLQFIGIAEFGRRARSSRSYLGVRHVMFHLVRFLLPFSNCFLELFNL